MTTRHLVVLLGGILLPLVIIYIISSPLAHRRSQLPWQRLSAAPTLPPLNPRTGVILRPAAAAYLFPSCSRSFDPLALRYWTPDSASVRRLEANLPAYLHSWDADPRINYFGRTHDLASYYRQYLGVVDLEGRATIYVNAIAPELLERHLGAANASRSDWRTFPLQVCDGADDFWSVEFDPVTQAFRAFAFDGSA